MPESKTQETSEESILIAEQLKESSEPPLHAVLLHNDDYTTMEIVIEILRLFFHKKEEEAVQIMLQIHQKGKGLAGIYHLEIAETKVQQVHQRARSGGFPLRCSTEPVA